MTQTDILDWRPDKTKDGGTIDFGSLEFTKEGTYKFTIAEDNLGKTGYTYDDSRYEVTVTVTLNPDTNQYEVKKTIEKITADGTKSEADEIVFENKYVPLPVVSDPPVEKVVKGDTPDTPGNFTFILKAEEAENPMPEGSDGDTKEMSVKGAGSVEFGDITFTKTGTYVYKISEKDNKEANYTYDKTEYTVTYVVTDNDGQLEVVRTIEADGKESEKAVFTNEYKKPVVPSKNEDTKKGNGGVAGVVKKAIKTVRTGDVSNPIFWGMIAVLSVMGAVVVFLSRRRRRND